MKNNQRVILAFTLVAASCGAIYQVNRTLNAAAARSGPATSEKAVPARPGFEDSKGPDGAASPNTREPSARPAKKLREIPSGIDSETWKQSSAIVTLMSTMSDGLNPQLENEMNAETKDTIREIAGMDETASVAFEKLVDARNDAGRVASEALMKEMMADPDKLTEVISLSLMEMKGTLNPEQSTRMKELEPALEKLAKPYEDDMKPWYEDDRFLTSVRSILDPDGLADFNQYAAEERQAGLNEKVDKALSGLELDDARRAALAKSIEDGESEREALQAILTPEESENLVKLKAKSSPFSRVTVE